ncbi:MAG: hypothetical protein SPI06_05280 [Terrisporobacter sp.]|uniref:helix-hairpin-helix domain-containing protein n=1 Tax=Terrisporobacter sp. TaxID=1965305 RepID=UPI002A9178A8|nr:hypothetical protein [Terrisporobacter sp.]MDY6152807.1 hypothetical protein [Terrisporobacter sp.]
MCKLDLLGLKTLDVLDKCLKSINKDYTVDDLYKKIETCLDNKKMFNMINEKETEGIFQMESPLFKSLVETIIPTDINDICAILACGRPGPLGAGMHTAYGNRKNGFEDSIPQLRNTEDITGDTYNTIIYQEQCMLISKKVAKFDDSQSDSLCRKPLAKKKKKLMEIFRKCFIFGKKNCEPPKDYDETDENQPYYDPKGKYGKEILGGINNGYTYEELAEFYEKLKGYCSYLFNKSHSASYSVITLCTMYLKANYYTKFFAALLSMQTKEEKIDMYIKLLKANNIKIKCPNINISTYDFTEDNGDILYGLNAIKGVGVTSIPTLIENRPYKNIEDAIERVPKKALNKKVLSSLIMSGAFDFEDNNRYKLLNLMYDLRKDKDERYDENNYNKISCMNFEKDRLGTSVTYQSEWDKIQDKEQTTLTFNLIDTEVRKDKRGKDMAFLKLEVEGVEINALAFSSLYAKNISAFDTNITKSLTLLGKKDNNKFIINKIINRNLIA